MRNKLVSYFILLIILVLCIIFISEVISFIGIFCGILISVIYFTVKGIWLNDMFYSLIIFSFCLLFFILAIRKFRLLLLSLGILLSFSVMSAKIHFSGKALNPSKTTINPRGSLSENLHEKTTAAPIKEPYESSCKMEMQNAFRIEEHFDSRWFVNWQILKYSFPENGCEMKASQVHVKNSILTLSVGSNKNNPVKPYIGGEIGSIMSFLYGKFTVRMKNQIAPGTVSSFFLMNKWLPENWEHKEIDIEFLGKNTKAVQFTVHDFREGGNKHVYNEYTHFLGFDSSDDFHDYSILWSKDSISWLVDGKWVHSVKDILINEEMYIRLNHWAGAPGKDNTTIINWLGPLDTCKLPSEVCYDYIEYQSL